MGVLLRKHVSREFPGGFLVPAYKKDWEWLAKKKQNALIVAEDHTPPSAKLRNLYWAILGRVCDNSPYYHYPKQLHVAIKHALDYYNIVIDHDMNFIKEMRSTSDLESNWEDYKEFCDRAFDFIFTYIMPGQKKAFIQEVEKMLGYTYADAKKGNRGKDEGEMYDDNAE